MTKRLYRIFRDDDGNAGALGSTALGLAQTLRVPIGVQLLGLIGHHRSAPLANGHVS